MGRLKKITDKINHGLQSVFYRLGIVIGDYPYRTMIISVAIFGLCMIGIIRFQRESRGSKLWVDQDSQVVRDKEWVERHFPAKFVMVNYIGIRPTSSSDAGVLEASAVKQLYQMHTEVIAIQASNGSALFNWSRIAYPRKGDNYWATTILALWEYNGTIINSLTTADILRKINEPNLQDPWNGGPFLMNSVLGALAYNNEGNISGAGATQGMYRIYVNETWDSGAGEFARKRADDFSVKYERIVRKKWSEFNEMAVFTQKGAREENSRAIDGDVTILSAGYILILLYVILNLGRYNRLEHKVWLSFSGILSTGMAIGISFSLSSAFGFFYGPVHSVLPFLLLGIGVDDMFVIVQAWDNLHDDPENKKKTVSERMGICLSRAGASVTVTSITDFVAFLIGATTILPALRSFCFFAGVGVFADFCMQITFFAATLALDGRRMEDRRDACCFCVKLPDKWQPLDIEGRWLLRGFKKYHIPALELIPVKIFVLLATVALASVGIYASTQIENHFEFDWFYPDGSYILRFQNLQKQYFPAGRRGQVYVYVGNVNYSSPVVQGKLHELADAFKANSYIQDSSVDPWIDGMEQWSNETGSSLTGDDNFYSALPKFLEVPQYSHFGSSFSYHNVPRGQSNESLQATRFGGLFIDLPHTRDRSNAMDSTRSTASSVVFPNGERAHAFIFSFLPWTTNKVIDVELRRNLLLAMAAVFIVAVFIIADLLSAFYVLVCVGLTILDTIMVMYYWDLTINTVTTIILILSVGLAVDYSAHVAHEFMVAQGTRNERVAYALTQIGVAVFNGGFSTFLAFVFLSMGNSYVFKTFFKVFLAVVIFGLFHGLIFLPVILSLIGPPSHGVIETSKVEPVDADSGEKTLTVANGNTLEPVDGDIEMKPVLV